MAYTTIDDPSAYFQPALYTGSTSNITVNIDMRPDFFWFKSRTQTYSHLWYDTSRPSDGTSMPTGDVNMYSKLSSDSEDDEDDNNVDGLVQTSTGFIVDGDGQAIGEAGQGADNMVAWCWKCNGGTTSSFTESGNNPGGTIQTNTDAGFSIITTTGTGGAGTISHGLGAVPHWIISKCRSHDNTGWGVYHKQNTSEPETELLGLASNGATLDSPSYYNDTAPTSSVFTVGTSNDINGDGRTYVFYVFTEKQGYSKFGSYAGNNSTDGPFVYTGFTPAWVMIKRTDGGTNNWPIWDYERGGYNGAREELYANLNNAKATDSAIDILSNGFKLRNASTEWNNGTNYIYMAFAKHPFVSSKGVPTTAV